MFSLSTIITTVVMVGALVGMIACAKKQQINPKAQPIAIALLVVVIICGVSVLFQTGILGPGETAGLIENEHRYAHSEGIILGKHLTSNYIGSKALIIVDRNYEKDKRTMTIIDGLKEGFDGRITVKAIDTPDIEMPEMPEGVENEDMTDVYSIEELLKAENMDAILEKHSDCDLVISMINLPIDADKMALWGKDEEERQKLVIFNGDIQTLKDAIHEGLVKATITYKPGVKFSEKSCPSDPQVAFDERYILITTENIEKVAEQYPQLFGVK